MPIATSTFCQPEPFWCFACKGWGNAENGQNCSEITEFYAGGLKTLSGFELYIICISSVSYTESSVLTKQLQRKVFTC